MTARLLSVNVVHALIVDPVGSVGRTAIDKRPVEGRVTVNALGVLGDTVLDRPSHGGIDKAVYAYAREDLVTWEAELNRSLSPGTFGENLTTLGLDVTSAVIGEHWDVESLSGPPVRLEVSMPRTPCATFQAWLGEPHWVRRFTERGAPGAYLRVLNGGKITAGAAVTVVNRPEHGVTIGEVFGSRQADPDRLRLLLDQPGLASELVDAVSRYAL